MRTPSASRTSAEPQRELAARLPCLATLAPAAEATIAATVEILKVSQPSPPVPQVSIKLAGRKRSSEKTGAAWRRITLAKPASSCGSVGGAFMARRGLNIGGGPTRAGRVY